jgi:hypothetical protein
MLRAVAPAALRWSRGRPPSRDAVTTLCSRARGREGRARNPWPAAKPICIRADARIRAAPGPARAERRDHVRKQSFAAFAVLTSSAALAVTALSTLRPVATSCTALARTWSNFLYAMPFARPISSDGNPTATTRTRSLSLPTLRGPPLSEAHALCHSPSATSPAKALVASAAAARRRPLASAVDGQQHSSTSRATNRESPPRTGTGVVRVRPGCWARPCVPRPRERHVARLQSEAECRPPTSGARAPPACHRRQPELCWWRTRQAT